MDVWKSLSNDIKHVLHGKILLEFYQECLNELSLVVNAGVRKSCDMTLDDDKKHSDFSDEEHVR